MPIIYEKIDFKPHTSLVARWNKFKNMSYPLHQHDEYELLFVYRSYGTRYVGNSIELFKEGDLVLVGPNLPHCWQNDEIFLENHPSHQAKAVIIQFGKTFLSEVFQYPEFDSINKMLSSSHRGIHFGSETVSNYSDTILHLIGLTGFERLLVFLQLLQNLSLAADTRLLASNSFNKLDATKPDFHKISSTLQFISDNYQRTLSLGEISQHFHMSSSAFCNYFKRKTGKTLMSYLNEYRTAKACKLMTTSDKHIAEIAFECGFNNISYFNRTFKKVIGKNPTAYRKLWQKSLS